MAEKTLAKIVGDDDLEKYVQQDQFLAVVNQEPPEQFIKKHPIANGVSYIPIGKIEMMLTRIFQEWKVEILNSGQLLNAVYVNVRLHFKHPLTKEWSFHDGTGAVAIQTNKDKSPADLGEIKSNAIMLALPAAKSFAIKDAAEHIGKLFGRDLNRKDTMAFTPSYDVEEKEAKKKAMQEKLNADN